MAKVKNPLLSGDVSGAFGKKMIFRRGGVVSRMFKPRNPNTEAQRAVREAFKEFSMSGLTQEQADLLYSAIAHLHDDRYLQSVPQQDHGGLSGLGDDDHSQYHNDTRGDARYVKSGVAPTWTAPTFQNSWINYGGSYAPCGFYKDANSVVHFSGVVKNGTVNTVIFTLPNGFRPGYESWQPVQIAGGIGYVGFYANGEVKHSASSNTYFAFDGVILDV